MAVFALRFGMMVPVNGHDETKQHRRLSECLIEKGGQYITCYVYIHTCIYIYIEHEYIYIYMCVYVFNHGG